MVRDVGRQRSRREKKAASLGDTRRPGPSARLSPCWRSESRQERNCRGGGMADLQVCPARRSLRRTPMLGKTLRAYLILVAATLALAGCVTPTSPAPPVPAEQAPSLPANLPADADRSDVARQLAFLARGLYLTLSGDVRHDALAYFAGKARRPGRRRLHPRRPTGRRKSASTSFSRKATPSDRGHDQDRGTSRFGGSTSTPRRFQPWALPADACATV